MPDSKDSLSFQFRLQLLASAIFAINTPVQFLCGALEIEGAPGNLREQASSISNELRSLRTTSRQASKESEQAAALVHKEVLEQLKTLAPEIDTIAQLASQTDGDLSREAARKVREIIKHAGLLEPKTFRS